jgi:hypothetical protein
MAGNPLTPNVMPDFDISFEALTNFKAIEKTEKTLVDPATSALLELENLGLNLSLGTGELATDLGLWEKAKLTRRVLASFKEGNEELALQTIITILSNYETFSKQFSEQLISTFFNQIEDIAEAIYKLLKFNASFHACGRDLLAIEFYNLVFNQRIDEIDLTVSENCLPILQIQNSLKGLAGPMQEVGVYMAEIMLVAILEKDWLTTVLNAALEFIIVLGIEAGKSEKVYAFLHDKATDPVALGEMMGAFFGVLSFELITSFTPVKFKHLDKVRDIIDTLGTVGSLLPDEGPLQKDMLQQHFTQVAFIPATVTPRNVLADLAPNSLKNSQHAISILKSGKYGEIMEELVDVVRITFKKVNMNANIKPLRIDLTLRAMTHSVTKRKHKFTPGLFDNLNKIRKDMKRVLEGGIYKSYSDAINLSGKYNNSANMLAYMELAQIKGWELLTQNQKLQHTKFARFLHMDEVLEAAHIWDKRFLELTTIKKEMALINITTMQDMPCVLLTAATHNRNAKAAVLNSLPFDAESLGQVDQNINEILSVTGLFNSKIKIVKKKSSPIPKGVIEVTNETTLRELTGHVRDIWKDAQIDDVLKVKIVAYLDDVLKKLPKLNPE